MVLSHKNYWVGMWVGVDAYEASEIILVDRDGLERIISEGSIYFNSLVS